MFGKRVRIGQTENNEIIQTNDTKSKSILPSQLFITSQKRIFLRGKNRGKIFRGGNSKNEFENSVENCRGLIKTIRGEWEAFAFRSVSYLRARLSVDRACYRACFQDARTRKMETLARRKRENGSNLRRMAGDIARDNELNERS